MEWNTGNCQKNELKKGNHCQHESDSSARGIDDDFSEKHLRWNDFRLLPRNLFVEGFDYAIGPLWQI
jgi:hypothetical protein